MGKNKYNHRIERLFTDLDPAEPQPEAPPAGAPPEDGQAPSAALPDSPLVTAPGASGQPDGGTPGSGWDVFLDGLRGTESQEPDEATPPGALNGSTPPASQEDAEALARLHMLSGWGQESLANDFAFGEQEGNIIPEPSQSMPEDDPRDDPLASGSDDSLQQPLPEVHPTPVPEPSAPLPGSLVPLAPGPRHSRAAADEVARRAAQQSWQGFLESTQPERFGYQFHQNQVAPLDLQAPLPGEAFPLKVRDEIIGSLAIADSIYSLHDAEDLVGVITDRLSIHLDGLRLAEQREQALSETEALYNISARLSTAQSLEEALNAISEPIRHTGMRDSRLFFVALDERGHPEGLSLAVVWYPEEGAQQVPVNAPFLLEHYPAYWHILQDPLNPLLFSNVLTDPRLPSEARELFVKTGAHSSAILPLAVSGRWVGVISLNWETPHEFTLSEARLYASLSRQAAVVVNNRLLLEQTRKRAQELQTVAQVSTAASTILDPHELLQSVVDLAKSSFSLYHTQVYQFFDREGFYEVVAGAGETGRRIADEHAIILYDSLSTVGRCGRERQVIILNDIRHEPGFVTHPLLPEVRSEMAIPMVVGERLLGVFNVQSDSPNRFTREDARIYTTLASQVAVALQNAELYAEQAATVDRLRELDHLKSAFLANMSHELRTPLNSILGFAEVLLLGLDGPLNDTMINDIQLIEKNGKHLLSLINDVLDMAKIEAGKMNLAFDKFLLRELIEETMDITSSLVREKSLYLSIDPASQDRIDLVADRVRLRQVLINIVSNAVKFTEKGGITICVVQFPEERKVHIRVTDTGIGVPQDKLELIFDSFSQVDTSTTRKAGGTGLGLPISRRLVELHGGRLWAESTGTHGEGSTLIIELLYEAIKT